MADKTIIDVSVYQGVIDWAKVKPNIDGAIIRIGYGQDMASQDDKYAEKNIQECEKLGIPWGPYIYSYANSVNKVKSEFEHMKRICKGHKPSFPWYLDIEENRYGSFAKTAVVEWKKLCTAAGVKPGVYTGAYYFKNFVSGVDTAGISWWIAAYGTNNGTQQTKFKPSIGFSYDGWQYTSVKKFDGIKGGVDTSVFYKGLNGEKTQTSAVSKPVTETAKKTIDELAHEVISGKWGNGEYRIKKLSAAGYDANAVQKRVNEILKVPAAKKGIEYVVKKGDTLSGIASKYGLEYKKIAKDNRISNPNLIYVGQKIMIYR